LFDLLLNKNEDKVKHFLLNKMKKTGRPKLSEDAKMVQITGVRLRDEERQLLEEKASSEGKTLSAWMRDALVKAEGPVVASPAEQREFLFEELEPLHPASQYALWTPRDIWLHLNQRYIPIFKEDRRTEYKNHKAPNLDDLATYYSAFSNTPDGGVIVYGVANDGEIFGCNHFSANQLNEIETCHVNRCPMAKPEFKRIPVVVGGREAFCLAIYVPYIGRLVETNKVEAWIRFGESRHKMSEEEKQDFRSTRQELSFELSHAPLFEYPRDFDLRIIQDFCDSFREREQRPDWTNEEVLVDRNLLTRSESGVKPVNALVLMAANRPGLSIPGCRVRVQRFDTPTEGAGERYSPLRDKTIEGNLVKIIQDAREAISSIIFDVTWLNADGKFVTTPEYPQWAWFEALVNACVHRSYSFSGTEITVKIFPDRMEIESPGGFVPPVNEKTIDFTRSSRNHHLMDALRYLGYVRMAREGVRRIRESMSQYRLPEPKFTQEALHGVVVRVVLRNNNRERASDKAVAEHFGVDVWKNLTENEIKIAAFAFRNGEIHVLDAQNLTGQTWHTSKRTLERLVKKNVLLFKPGKYVRDSRAVYVLAKPKA
jgi:ATP-dependent DNA helicase RecG